MVERADVVERADRVLARLWILTLIVGGLATLAVVFLADVVLARLAAAPVTSEAVAVEMSEALELHQWLAYKAVLVENDKEANYHVEQALALATERGHRSDLDGLLREHLPSGHFVHVRQTLKDWLDARPEPGLPQEQLEMQAALALLKDGNVDEAQAQVQHFIASGIEREAGEKILEAITEGDLEAATRFLGELAGTP